LKRKRINVSVLRNKLLEGAEINHAISVDLIAVTIIAHQRAGHITPEQAAERMKIPLFDYWVLSGKVDQRAQAALARELPRFTP